MESPQTLTSEDKLWAAVAHGSVILSFWGPILAVVVWFTQRKKSGYARFHALQAMSYQVLSMWLWMTLVPLLFIVFIPISMFAAPALTGRLPADGDFFGPLFPLLIWLPMLAIWGLYLLLGIIGAVACLMGREFRYPFFGSPLARKLNYSAADRSSMSEAQEDQVTGAVGHATSLFTLFGVVTPFLLWITEKDRSPRLRFQALQAAVYQGLGALAYLVLMAIYMLSIFGFMGLGIFTAAADNARTGGILMLLGMLPFLCVAAALFIGGPLYQLFAFIASLKVLRGNDYNYPWLGKYLRRRMDQPQPAREEAA